MNKVGKIKKFEVYRDNRFCGVVESYTQRAAVHEAKRRYGNRLYSGTGQFEVLEKTDTSHQLVETN